MVVVVVVVLLLMVLMVVVSLVSLVHANLLTLTLRIVFILSLLFLCGCRYA